jgi:probable rRNA maturation factor
VIDVEARSDLDVDVAPLVDLLRRVCGRLGVTRATLGLMIVTAEEMAAINGEHRQKTEPTDVLAFPVDGPEALGAWPADGPPPELGDIVICPDAAQEPLGTLAVHGLLHLLGYDHEVDAGEMLALQDTLLAEVAP